MRFKFLIQVTILFIINLICFQNVSKGQGNVYWREGFDTRTGTVFPTTDGPAQYAVGGSSGVWYINGVILTTGSATNNCSGPIPSNTPSHLRLRSTVPLPDTAYVVTPVVNNGIQNLNFINGRAGKDFTIWKTNDTSATPNSWTLVAVLNSPNTCELFTTVSINDADAKRLKIQSRGDTDIDSIWLTSTGPISEPAPAKYYVATAAAGGNDANAGTSLAAPFATLARALLSATVPGDTIFVRSGTYTVASTINISRQGTQARPFVITAYKPDLVNANSRPVFDFSSMSVSGSNRGFLLSSANFWHIYGLVIKGAGGNGMFVSQSNNTIIEFCSFLRNRDTGLQLGNGSRKTTVLNCDSYENADFGPGTTTNGGNADGFAPKLTIGDSTLFRGCRAWLNSDDGWDGYMRTPLGSDNVTTFLEDCWAFRNGYYWLDGTTTADMNGNGFKMGGSDTKDLSHNFVLTKCLSFQNKAHGYDQNSNAGSMYLYNNSAYRNLGRDYALNSSGVTYKPGAQLVIKNNMSLGAGGVSIPTGSTSVRTLISATNSFSTAITHPEILSFDTTGVTGMRNIDGSLPTLNFMRLNSAAPQPHTYIDKGTVLNEVTYQGVLGVPFKGAAPDLGAFESDFGALPVKMLSFTAFNNQSSVLLNWKVATEVNNKGWSVERMANSDGTWQPLGFVAGRNYSAIENTYTYLDKNVSAGIYFYRLKQLDMDDKATFSNVLFVKIANTKNEINIGAYPNPVSTHSTIRYIVPTKAKVTVTIFNQQGQMVSRLIDEVQQAGTYQKLMNAKLLTAGKYYLKLTVGEQIVTESFLKQ